MSTIKWQGEKPTHCQICNNGIAIGQEFVDGKTVYGPWAIMCRSCHNQVGVGLGTGRGQTYTREA